MALRFSLVDSGTTVRTRPGLVSQYSTLAGAPQVNGVKTYITTNLVQRMLVLDSLGNPYAEITPGVLSLIVSGAVGPNLHIASTTYFGREYMAFGDGSIGQDMPRQYDDSNYDRVSQVGPGEGPTVVDSTNGGSISPGVHQVAVVFVTRQGYWTAPSPVVSWTAGGRWKANLTNVPTGPSNVVQRLLAFTASGLEFLQCARHDDDQRQYKDVGQRRCVFRAPLLVGRTGADR
jgi:hypothetical protein